MLLTLVNRFKDEVRSFGRQLGIHEDLIMRHPFPGPGIGVRIVGEVTAKRVEIVRKADHIFISMIREAGLYNEVRTPAPRFPIRVANRNRSPKPTLRLIRTKVCILSRP